jgi:serine phosphatase RsbU (regulator of sigma subunit)/anti-sigma regulatory factor (Ser/Thr protein kinase)
MNPAVQGAREVTDASRLRDSAMAAALRRLGVRLRCDTATAYLVTADGRRLVAAMTLDTPLGFTITPHMATDDTHFTTTAAYLSDEVVVMDPGEIRTLVERHPSMMQYVPFDMMVASVPLRTARRRHGVITVRWTPPQPVDHERERYLRSVADELALVLEVCAESGASLLPPAVPLFVAEHERPALEGPAVGAGIGTDIGAGISRDRGGGIAAGTDTAAGPGATRGVANADLRRRSSFLFLFQRLATDLTAAVRSTDIVTAARTQVMEPFSGSGMMLCLTEGGRLRVVGSAGLAREQLRQVDGQLLTSRSPETDAAGQMELLSFGTPGALHRAYPDLDRYDDERGWGFFPLIASGRSVGCCVMAFEPHHERRPEELAVLMLMLGQVAQSLERTRSYELEQDLTQSMQHGLLPRKLPHLPEIVTTARYLPATAGAAVGGDWYDVIRLPDGQIGLVIGDVEGHSLEAVGIMGQLRSGVRAYAAEGHDPASVLTRSNRLLADLDTDLFATCCCLWLDLRSKVACIASAGHPAPLLVVGPADQPLEVDPPLDVGPPLGVDLGATYRQSETVLPPGATVALYTDGLLDARRLGTDSAVDRLRLCLADNRGENLEILADRIVADAQPDTRRDDDSALLLMRYEGAEEGHGRIARMTVQRHDLQRVRQVRHFLGQVLHVWGLDGLLDALQLLASEVVTNALIHAHSEVDVRLREYPDRIRVEVRDSDPHPPVPVPEPEAEEAEEEPAESGRGLLIVDAVAAAWGSSPAGRGKTTWFEIAIPPPA